MEDSEKAENLTLRFPVGFVDTTCEFDTAGRSMVQRIPKKDFENLDSGKRVDILLTSRPHRLEA
jgi:hypothetical protein